MLWKLNTPTSMSFNNILLFSANNSLCFFSRLYQLFRKHAIKPSQLCKSFVNHKALKSKGSFTRRACIPSSSFPQPLPRLLKHIKSPPSKSWFSFVPNLELLTVLYQNLYLCYNKSCLCERTCESTRLFIEDQPSVIFP